MPSLKLRTKEGEKFLILVLTRQPLEQIPIVSGLCVRTARTIHPRLDNHYKVQISFFLSQIYVFLWFWFVGVAIMSGLAIVYRMVVILVPSLRYLCLCHVYPYMWHSLTVICGSLTDVKLHVVDICNTFRVSVICARALNQVSVTNVINLFLNSSLEHRMITIWMKRMIL